jgi:nitrous oxidase accessory protein
LGSTKKQLGLLIALILLLSLVILPHATVKAQTKTIIVPDSYPSITDAIGNATNGDKILVRAGFYSETQLDSNVSISLIGEGAGKTKINLHPPIVTTTIGDVTLSGYAAPIGLNANNIVISGFTITSDGGTAVIKGNNEWLTDNVLDLNVEVTGNYNTVTNNTLTLPLSPIMGGMVMSGSHGKICQNAGTGLISISAGSFNNVFYNALCGEIGDFGTGNSNLFYGNKLDGGTGMSAQTNDILDDNAITNCSYGVSITNGFNNIVDGNRVTNNSGAGLSKIEGLNNLFYGNYVADNSFGVQIGAGGAYRTNNGGFTPMGNTTFYDNDFVSNRQQVQVIVSSLTDDWNYGKQGNYWSDYQSSYPNASEVGFSGIWNTPYYVGLGEQDNYPLMAPFDISSINIQLPSWANITVPSPLQMPSFPSQNLANPQTSPTISATPTPTAPEFPSLILVLTLFIAVSTSIAVKMTVRKRKIVE